MSTLELIVLGNLLDLIVLGLAFGLAGWSVVLLFLLCSGPDESNRQSGSLEKKANNQNGYVNTPFNDEEQA